MLVVKLRRERRLIPANSATYPRARLAWALLSNWYIFTIITYILAACTYCLSLFPYAAEIFSHQFVAAILAKFLSVCAQCLGFLMGFSSNFERASLFVGALMPWGTTNWKTSHKRYASTFIRPKHHWAMKKNLQDLPCWREALSRRVHSCAQQILSKPLTALWKLTALLAWECHELATSGKLSHAVFLKGQPRDTPSQLRSRS